MVSATAVVKAMTSCFTSLLDLVDALDVEAGVLAQQARRLRAAPRPARPALRRRPAPLRATAETCSGRSRSGPFRAACIGQSCIGQDHQVIEKLRLASVCAAIDKPRVETALLQRLARHQPHDLRMIVLLAEMAQDQRRRCRIPDRASGKSQTSSVRKVAHAAHHALLHGPRIRANLQHVQIVIGFEQQQVGARADET